MARLVFQIAPSAAKVDNPAARRTRPAALEEERL